MGISGSGSLVDHYQFLSGEVINQPGSRINCQGCAADDQHLGIMNISDSLVDGLLVKTLLIEYHIWFYGSAAFFTYRYSCGMLDVSQVMELPALFAIIAQHRSMQFQHDLAARSLVETVNILGDDSPELSGCFQWAAFGLACGKSILLR